MAPGTGNGNTREVLLGRPTPAEHASQPGYVGAVVGRWANRIGGSRCNIDGREHRLAANEGLNQQHGGPDGFDRRVWRCVDQGPRHVTLALHSPDGDQGWPGALDALDAQVRYAIESPGCVLLKFEARVDRPCPVNLTRYAYFNPDGGDGIEAGTGSGGSEGTGGSKGSDGNHRLGGATAVSVAAHRIAIAAAHWLPVDDALIPPGSIAPVAGTLMDLRRPRAIGSQRFDHCFVLEGAHGSGQESGQGSG